MRSFFSLPRPVLMLLAIVFAAATTFYSGIWMYYIRWQPRAQLGIEYRHESRAAALQVTQVYPRSAAERAGLRPGDRIAAINGRPLDTTTPFISEIQRAQPGDQIRLSVNRPGAGQPLALEATLGVPQPRPAVPLIQTIALQLIQSYPVLFLVVGFAVLFLRLQERNAWLLALFFAGLIASAPLLPLREIMDPRLLRFALPFMIIFRTLAPAAFYYLFAVFPEPSPVDNLFPRLKTVLLAGAAAVAVPWAVAVAAGVPLEIGGGLATALGVYGLGVCGLGLVSLVWNSLCCTSAESRRKTRVIVWGMVLGLTPVLVLQVAAGYAGQEVFEFPFWIWAPTVLGLFLMPLSFAYAVVKHQVLEIHVMLKRSARYVLVQRGLVVAEFLTMLAATVAFVITFSRLFQPRPEIAVPAGLLVGVGFGILLASAGTQVEQRITRRLDRAFFRSSYDAQRILEDLAEKTRAATDRADLAELLGNQLAEALHPRTLAIYLESGDGRLALAASRNGDSPATAPAALSAEMPALQELRRRGSPWSVLPAETSDGLAVLAPVEPDCLVPLLGRDARLVGLVVLGPRLSDEPYSREDKRLLSLIAAPAGLVLESILLAEKMAVRLEAERRTAYEIDVAQRVQARLFPEQAPPLGTLDYVGRCIQARAVGGDYYDFVQLGPGRVGLVLADICGKGIGAALLMAHLQANLRSQYSLARDDMGQMLSVVNRLFHGATPASSFATLFFGAYDDDARRLRYANCGHNAPLLLRAGGEVEWLSATATVLGMFPQWECTIGEVQLDPGDVMVAFSDGLPDAETDEGEPFGEQRLVEIVLAHRGASPSELLQVIVDTVQGYTGREREDDLTLLVARAV